MHTPVFIDNLPEAEAVTGRKPGEYRLLRNKALIDLLLQDELAWHERDHCPACRAPADHSRPFSIAHGLDFQRCAECETIYAARVPNQGVLDQLRLAQLAEVKSDQRNRSFEYSSLLNWIQLTEVHLGRKLRSIVDFRFGSEAQGWQEFVHAHPIDQDRAWAFVPLAATSDADSLAALTATLKAKAPEAVLVLVDLDRAEDPSKILATIKANTAPGTLAFIATSCADGLEYALLGASSPSFVPLDRLTLFSVAGMKKWAAQNAAQVREISTPGRLDAVILERYFKGAERYTLPFWSGFFRDADSDQLNELQVLLQRSLKSGVMRVVLEL